MDYEQFEEEKKFIESLEIEDFEDLNFDVSSGDTWSKLRRLDDPRASYSAKKDDFDIALYLYKNTEFNGYSIKVETSSLAGFNKKTFNYYNFSWAYDAFCFFINKDSFWIDIDNSEFKLLKNHIE